MRLGGILKVVGWAGRIVLDKHLLMFKFWVMARFWQG